MEGAVCCDVAAILGKGRVVDCGVPVAALPASDSCAERVGKVVIIPICC